MFHFTAYLIDEFSNFSAVAQDYCLYLAHYYRLPENAKVCIQQ